MVYCVAERSRSTRVSCLVDPGPEHSPRRGGNHDVDGLDNFGGNHGINVAAYIPRCRVGVSSYGVAEAILLVLGFVFYGS